MRKGFTLAEVLITLGIIGVVAVLTLPPIIQNHQERATVAKVKKAYSILSQAFLMAVEGNGTVNYWCSEEDIGVDCSYKIFDKIKPYLKIIKADMHYGSSSMGSGYKNRFTEHIDNVNAKGPNFVLVDGISVLIEASGECSGDTNSLDFASAENKYERYMGSCANIYVDVNSKAGPNVWDRDLLRFKLYRNGITLTGLPIDVIWTDTFENQCLGKNYYQGGYCSGWIVLNGNMDYLHCDDLSWNGKHKCK